MNNKVTLQDIVNLLTEKQGLNKKEAELFVRSMFDLIEEALTTEKYVKVKGLGTFKLTEVDSRESVNVNTGERIEIQGHTKITFTPDTTMKEQINKPFSHFETVILNDGVQFDDAPTETTEPVTEPVEQETTPGIKAEAETLVPESLPEEPVAEEETPAESQISETPEPEPVIEEAVIPTNEDVQAPKTPSTTSEETEENLTEEPVQPIPTEEPDSTPEETPTVSSPTDEAKKSSPILWGIIIILVLIILFGAYWLFLRPAETTEIVSVTPIKQETVVANDSIEEKAPQEETPAAKEETEPATPQEPQPVVPIQTTGNERVPSLADTLEYRITGTKTTYTLQNGETIIKASVKFFGTKKFWPYIVKHNQDAIKDADNIPAGISIKIPELAPRN